MPPIKVRRCSRCSEFFEPVKSYYRLCNKCRSETYSAGHTHSRQRPGGPGRMHGSQSRLIDGTLWRSLVWRGDQSRLAILAGFKEFATDYYRHSAGLSTIFRNAGFDEAALNILGQPPQIDDLLMSFCPTFREWVHGFAGEKAMELIIECYGLYGDPKLTLEILEDNLGLNDAEAYRTWAFGKLRHQDAKEALEQIASAIGNRILQKARS